MTFEQNSLMLVTSAYINYPRGPPLIRYLAHLPPPKIQACTPPKKSASPFPSHTHTHTFVTLSAPMVPGGAIHHKLITGGGTVPMRCHSRARTRLLCTKDELCPVPLDCCAHAQWLPDEERGERNRCLQCARSTPLLSKVSFCFMARSI